jgi:hypothetical protein
MRTFGEQIGVVPRSQIRADSVELITKKYGFKSLLSSKTLVGVEIELENCRVTGKDTRKEMELAEYFNLLWNVVEDGSLRNTGKEFVTKQGLTAEDSTIALQLFEPYLNTWYGKAVPNFRTGLHVHLNCTDFTIEQIGNLFLLYVLFEQNLFEQSGKRGNSKYSVPLREAKTTFPEIIYWLANNVESQKKKETRAWEKFYGYLRNGTKYCGLNYNSLVNHGTVEFRHHKGTKDISEIMDWMRVLLCIHEYARKADFSQCLKRIREINTISDYMQLRDEVFTRDALRFFTTGDHSFKKDMCYGSSYIKECLIDRSLLPDVEVPADNDPFGELEPERAGEWRRARGLLGELRIDVPQAALPDNVVAQNMRKPAYDPRRGVRAIWGNYNDLRRFTSIDADRAWISEWQWHNGWLGQSGEVFIPAPLHHEYINRLREDDFNIEGEHVRAAKQDVDDWLYLRLIGEIQ